MTERLRFVTFDTDIGWVGIAGTVKGLLRITLPQPSPQKAQQLLDTNDAIWVTDLFEDLIQRLKIYFAGHRVSFPDQLDLSGATPFQRKVWEITRLIPYGETKSYFWVATQIGNPLAARAVGQALGRNPLPIIIPCHRVLTSQGKLGGFSDGVQMKKRLLSLEAAASID